MAKILNPKPLALELEDLDGKLVSFLSVPLKPALTNQMRELATDPDLQRHPTAIIQQQLALVFGKTPGDFENFSALVLVSALQAFNEYSNTPIKTQG